MMYFWLWRLIRNVATYAFYTAPVIWRTKPPARRRLVLFWAFLHMLFVTLLGLEPNLRFLTRETGQLPPPKAEENVRYNCTLKYAQIALALVYVFFRLFLVLESFISLRHAPRDIYEVPTWSQLWHF
jgi:hypothetical protein